MWRIPSSEKTFRPTCAYRTTLSRMRRIKPEFTTSRRSRWRSNIEVRRISAMAAVCRVMARPKPKPKVRVERNIHTFVFAVIEIEFKAELGSANADSHRVARRLRACQREFKFHLGRELMTKDLGQNSIVGIDNKKIKCPQFF